MLSASIDDFVKKPDFGNHFPVIHGRSFVGVVKLFLLPVIKKKKKKGGGGVIPKFDWRAVYKEALSDTIFVLFQLIGQLYGAEIEIINT